MVATAAAFPVLSDIWVKVELRIGLKHELGDNEGYGWAVCGCVKNNADCSTHIMEQVCASSECQVQCVALMVQMETEPPQYFTLKGRN